MTNKNIILPPPFYEVKVKCRYPNITESTRLVNILYRYNIKKGEYVDLEFAAKYLSEKYSVRGISEWTVNMVLSKNIFIPIKLFNYLVKRHIHVTYIRRLTAEDILEIHDMNLKRMKVSIKSFDDSYIKKWKYLWEEEIDNFCVKVDDNLNHEILLKSNKLPISKHKNYNFKEGTQTFIYDLLLRKLIEKGIEICDPSSSSGV